MKLREQPANVQKASVANKEINSPHSREPLG